MDNPETSEEKTFEQVQSELVEWCQLVVDYWNDIGGEKYWQDRHVFPSRDVALVYDALTYLRLNTNIATQEVMDYLSRARSEKVPHGSKVIIK